METPIGPIILVAVVGVAMILIARLVGYWPLYIVGGAFLVILVFMIQPDMSIEISSPVKPAYWAILAVAIISAGLGVIFIKPGQAG